MKTKTTNIKDVKAAKKRDLNKLKNLAIMFEKHCK